MTAVGSSKLLSNREIFYFIFLFQQNGVFWLLPYFLVRENGTIGLCSIGAGVGAAALIILLCRYWGSRVQDCGFVTALQNRHRITGGIIGCFFALFYLLFAMVSLYGFVDVAQKQLLPETPRFILCAAMLLMAGWMSWNGLESIARITVLCVVPLFLMVAVTIAGSFNLFSIENALPLLVKNSDQMQIGALHSIFCYSGFLALFMVYPSRDRSHSMTGKLLLSAAAGALLWVLWMVYALGVFGEYSLQAILWIPVHLSRMVQISALLEQTEALFVVLWLPLVLANGGLLLWCASESLHQLLHKQKSVWVYGVMLTVLFGAMLLIENTVRLLELEYYLARGTLILLPVLLLAVVFLTPKRRESE